MIAAGGRRTTLAAPIPAGDETSPPVERIRLADADVAAALAAGDELTVRAGGLPDLFHFLTTPPPQLRHSPASEFAHLAALAAWLDLPLRPEKPADWNRRWFGAAVRLHPRRATLPGLEALLETWLADELLAVDRQTDGPPLILTDLTRRSNEIAAAFQLSVTATLGVDTVLGEGPPHLFIVDLPTAPEVAALRHPDGLEALQRAARPAGPGEAGLDGLRAVHPGGRHGAGPGRRGAGRRLRPPVRPDRPHGSALGPAVGVREQGMTSGGDNG